MSLRSRIRGLRHPAKARRFYAHSGGESDADFVLRAMRDRGVPVAVIAPGIHVYDIASPYPAAFYGADGKLRGSL